jgi:hypothetical protein
MCHADERRWLGRFIWFSFFGFAVFFVKPFGEFMR